MEDKKITINQLQEAAKNILSLNLSPEANELLVDSLKHGFKYNNRRFYYTLRFMAGYKDRIPGGHEIIPPGYR